MFTRRRPSCRCSCNTGPTTRSSRSTRGAIHAIVWQALGLNVDYREYRMQHELGRESLHDLSAWLTGLLVRD